MPLEDIFRAYDIRGVFNEDLTVDVAAKVGLVFGSYLGGSSRVSVGQDVRTSSPLLSAAFQAGVASSGCDVVSVGALPIPLANFHTWHRKFHNGAYITASHNPPSYNGIRFRHGDGSGFTHQNETIKTRFFNERMERKAWDRVGKMQTTPSEEVIDSYVGFLQGKLPHQKPLRIALDPGNGAGGLIAPRLLRDFGHTVSGVNMAIDGGFPGRGSQPKDGVLQELEAEVRATKAAFGAAFDGDGDRVVIVDDQGRTVQTEKLGIILARHLLQEQRGPVLVNIPCSMIVEEQLEPLGAKVIRTRVGDVFVCEALKEHKAVFGMEISAHFFLPQFYIFDDPFLVTLKLVEVLEETGDPLSALVDAIPSYPVIEQAVNVPDAIKFQVIDDLRELYEGQGERVDLTDGVKVSRQGGWGLLRCSNTQPMIRIFAEAHDAATLERLVKEFRQTLQGAIDRRC